MTLSTRVAATAAVLAMTTPLAMAEVNQAVRDACRNDYHKFCGDFSVGTPELRACMRSNATSLSQPCLKALVLNKEVTQEDIEKYLKEMEAKANASK
jgi:hypothetical protein